MFKIKSSTYVKLAVFAVTVLGISLFMSGGKALAAYPICPDSSWAPGNWGVQDNLLSNHFASVAVHAYSAKTNEDLNVKYRLNSGVEPGYNYGPAPKGLDDPSLYPNARIFKVHIENGAITADARYKQRWFETGATLTASPSRNCPGWDELGPGTSRYIGNGFMLDCQEVDVDGHKHNNRFWIDSISTPSGEAGRWGGYWSIKASSGGSGLQNRGFPMDYHNNYLAVRNGENARIDLVWHPNDPPPPVPPPNVRCSKLEVNGGGHYTTPNGKTWETRTYVRVTDSGGHELVRGADSPFSEIGPDGSKTWFYKPKGKEITVQVIRKYHHKNGTNWVWTEYYNNTTHHTCYDASCSIDISGENVPPNYPSDGIKHRSGFNVNSSIHNNAGPNEATDLYASLEPDGSQPLIFSQTNGPPLGFWDNPGRIPRHATATPSFNVGEPGWNIGHYDIEAKLFYDLDHNGYGGNDLVLATCSTGYDVYKEFDLKPTAGTMQLQYNGRPEAEDPNQAAFTWFVNNVASNRADVSVNTYRYIAKNGGLIPPYTPKVDSFNYGDYSRTDIANATNPKLGDQYCGSLAVSPAAGWDGPSGKRTVTISSRSTGASCDYIVNHPYVRAYGGDVVAGSSFMLDDVCNANAKRIDSYISTHPGKSGSGAQLAAIAMGTIQSFSSASLRTAAPTALTGLSFGNNGGNVGEYAGQPLCSTDFFGTTQSSDDNPADDETDTVNKRTYDGNRTLSPGTDLSADEDHNYGQTLVNGRLTLTGNSSFGGRKIIYVNGDVTITGNIAYTPFTDPTEAPAFMLVAKGNIYIEKQVTRLDGIYVAQANVDSFGNIIGGGTIFSCARPGDFVAYSDSGTEKFDNCGGPEGENSNPADDRRLIVNGAFIANILKLDRIHKSVRDSKANVNEKADHDPADTAHDTEAAEVFNYSPEMYLSQPPFASSSTSSASSIRFQYYTTLPPIL